MADQCTHLAMLQGLGEGVALPSMNNLVATWVPKESKAKGLGMCFSGFHTGLWLCWKWHRLDLPARQLRPCDSSVVVNVNELSQSVHSRFQKHCAFLASIPMQATWLASSSHPSCS